MNKCQDHVCQGCTRYKTRSSKWVYPHLLAFSSPLAKKRDASRSASSMEVSSAEFSKNCENWESDRPFFCSIPLFRRPRSTSTDSMSTTSNAPLQTGEHRVDFPFPPHQFNRLPDKKHDILISRRQACGTMSSTQTTRVPYPPIPDKTTGRRQNGRAGVDTISLQSIPVKPCQQTHLRLTATQQCSDKERSTTRQSHVTEHRSAIT